MNARGSNSGFLRGGALPYILIALVLLGALFYAFRPATEQESATAPPVDPTSRSPSQDPTEQSSSQSESRSFDLVIEQNRLVSDNSLIQVKEGDRVVLNVFSDSSDEFHLHGYDLKLQLTPDTRASLRFTADRAGRFEYELEKSHIELGALEVHPR